LAVPLNSLDFVAFSSMRDMIAQRAWVGLEQ